MRGVNALRGVTRDDDVMIHDLRRYLFSHTVHRASRYIDTRVLHGLVREKGKKTTFHKCAGPVARSTGRYSFSDQPGKTVPKQTLPLWRHRPNRQASTARSTLPATTLRCPLHPSRQPHAPIFPTRLPFPSSLPASLLLWTDERREPTRLLGVRYFSLFLNRPSTHACARPCARVPVCPCPCPSRHVIPIHPSIHPSVAPQPATRACARARHVASFPSFHPPPSQPATPSTSRIASQPATHSCARVLVPVASRHFYPSTGSPPERESNDAYARKVVRHLRRQPHRAPRDAGQSDRRDRSPHSAAPRPHALPVPLRFARRRRRRARRPGRPSRGRSRRAPCHFRPRLCGRGRCEEWQ